MGFKDRRAFLRLLGLSLGLAASPSAFGVRRGARLARVKDVRHSLGGGGAVTTISYAGGEPRVKSSYRDGSKFVLDISGMEINFSKGDVARKNYRSNKIFTGVKMAQNRPDVVRLVFYLAPGVEASVSQGGGSFEISMQKAGSSRSSGKGGKNKGRADTASKRDYQTRNVVESDGGDDYASLEDALRQARRTAKADGRRGAPPVAGGGEDDLADLRSTLNEIRGIPGDRARGYYVDEGDGGKGGPRRRSSTKRLSKRDLVLVLDPGHGGKDPGAIGKKRRIREKDVVLDIARKARAELRAMGYNVYMTRNEDVYVPLIGRVKKARKWNSHVLVSLHADSFLRPEARGSGVFMLGRSSGDPYAKYIARTQNQDGYLGNIEGTSSRNSAKLNSFVLNLSKRETLNKSEYLGREILKSVSRVNTLHAKNIKRAPLQVLSAPDIPSVLVETAFLSNGKEETLLSDPGFRNRMASAVARGIDNYMTNIYLS